MIPKIIHYCWFGGKPLPEEAIKCIESWKKFCPDYEIKEWNESNFDFSSCLYAKEAYVAKKWAFVSDYARFWILYNYGGLYFDTDVEIIKGIDDLVIKGPFMGSEPYINGNCRIAAGLGLCVEPGNNLYAEIMNHYKTLHFKISDGVYNDETIVTYITEIARKHGYRGNGSIEEVEGVMVYPPEFFCPMDLNTGEFKITSNTRTIHWYSASWKDEREAQIHKRALSIYRQYPNKIGRFVSEVYENSSKVFYYLKKKDSKICYIELDGKIDKSINSRGGVLSSTVSHAFAISFMEVAA